MEIRKEEGWKLHPVGGDTGKAYMGIRNQEKVFLKRNTSPFLATLAIEGIAPKLIWTKRIENGDVLTAQVWCNGRTLEESEMNSSRIVSILKKVHESKMLGRMLEKVEGRYLLSTDLLDTYIFELPESLAKHETLKKTYEYLLHHIDAVEPTPYYCANHGDIRHDNFLLSEQDDLFLVDWDNAVLADPAYDLGQLLARYIKGKQWTEWMEKNQIQNEACFISRIKWYAVATALLEVKEAHERNFHVQMNKWISTLNQWLQQL